tara:strand:+ start:2043 stop:2258 length:216 start_codon:yes stop_codon:yes gene_type:complete
MIVKHSGLNVTDVEETGWLWWESCNDFTSLGTFKDFFEAGVLIFLFFFHLLKLVLFKIIHRYKFRMLKNTY